MLLTVKQYPRVPNVIDSSWPLVVIEALRKKTDLRMGTLKETTARRPVAMRVTRKPGVAGRIRPIGGGREDESERGEREEKR